MQAYESAKEDETRDERWHRWAPKQRIWGEETGRARAEGWERAREAKGAAMVRQQTKDGRATGGLELRFEHDSGWGILGYPTLFLLGYPGVSWGVRGILCCSGLLCR